MEESLNAKKNDHQLIIKQIGIPNIKKNTTISVFVFEFIPIFCYTKKSNRWQDNFFHLNICHPLDGIIKETPKPSQFTVKSSALYFIQMEMENLNRNEKWSDKMCTAGKLLNGNNKLFDWFTSSHNTNKTHNCVRTKNRGEIWKMLCVCCWYKMS